MAGRDEAGDGAAPLAKVALADGLHCMLLPLLVLPLASVPLVSEDRALLRELRLASDGKASRRGGILSLMRSRPFASSKLVILCCGEKPLMAVEMQEKKEGERRREIRSDFRGEGLNDEMNGDTLAHIHPHITRLGLSLVWSWFMELL